MSGIKERREGKAKAAPASTAKTTASQAAIAPAGVQHEPTARTDATRSNASVAQTDPQPAPQPGTAEAAPKPDNVRTRELRSMEAMGAGVMWAMFAVDEAAKEDARYPRIVEAAKLFLIAVIFIAPVLLMWQHAF